MLACGPGSRAFEEPGPGPVTGPRARVGEAGPADRGQDRRGAGGPTVGDAGRAVSGAHRIRAGPRARAHAYDTRPDRRT